MDDKNNDISLDVAFDSVRATHRMYSEVDDSKSAPITYFIDAFHSFYGVLLKELSSERFADARPHFVKFAARVDELERDEYLSEVWREWEAAIRAVEHYDAAEKARLTPPTLSIDELLANGTNERLVAKIYGFFTEDGKPDVEAVRARKKWTPRPRKTTVTEETVAELKKEIEKKEASAKSTGIPNPSLLDVQEPTGKKKTSAPRKNAKQIETEIKKSVETSIDAEIEMGIAPRQIAARHGCSVEDVKKRAEELSAKKTETTDKSDKGEQ